MAVANLTPEHAQAIATAMQVPHAYIQALGAKGLDLNTILSYVAKYGLPVLSWLAQYYGIQLPSFPLPDVPPLPARGS